MPVIEITRAEFYEKILESKDAAILDCYAQWCPPCKAIAPKLEEWSEHYTDVKFYKVDVEAVPDVAQELNVTAMPTFMLFKGGEKVTEVVGAQAGVIENGIKTLLLGKE